MSYSQVHQVTIPGLRLHLRRADPNMLWINGRDLVLINDTAADFIEAFMEVMTHYPDKINEKKFKKEVAAFMQERYPDVPRKQLIQDFDNTYKIIIEISRGSCPIYDLHLDTEEIRPETWTAPPRMDLALTYQCNNNCSFCYTGGPQSTSELDTNEWKMAIDKLWDSGVPQIVFTGGEPTLREDLVDLIDYSRHFVTGLVTNGRRMALLDDELHRVDLDYVQISLESHIPEIHDEMVGVKGAWKETTNGIRTALISGLPVITNTTLTKDNMSLFPELIKVGADMGLSMMACNTLICSGSVTCRQKKEDISMNDLKAVLKKALETARDKGIKLDWYTPSCYKQLNPVEMGFGIKSCSAAQYNMTIEPDGSVIPCQSWFKDKLGNILKDEWYDIWNHPVAKGFREKTYLEVREECEGCEHLPQCSGGCPLEY